MGNLSDEKYASYCKLLSCVLYHGRTKVLKDNRLISKYAFDLNDLKNYNIEESPFKIHNEMEKYKENLEFFLEWETHSKGLSFKTKCNPLNSKITVFVFDEK